MKIFLMIMIFLMVLISGITGCKEGEVDLISTVTPITPELVNTSVIATVVPTPVIAEKPSSIPVLSNTHLPTPVSPPPVPDNAILEKLSLPENYVFVSQWGGEGADKGQFGWISGIAVGLNDNIYVIDGDKFTYTSNRIQCFTSNGKFIKQWGSDGEGEGQFHDPESITVGYPDGNIYIVDFDRVQKFTSEGKFITQWEAPSTTSVAVDSANKYLYAGIFPHSVGKCDLSGKIITTWRPFPWPWPGEAELPRYFIRGIAVNSKNNIIVLYCDSMERLNFQNGTYVRDGLERIFIIMEFAPDGYIIKVWNSQVKKIEENPAFGSMALDKQDNIYMTDYENNCVWKFNPDGKLLARWGFSGPGEGQFNAPNGIAVDSEGNVYVVDAKNNRIQKFKLDGNYQN